MEDQTIISDLMRENAYKQTRIDELETVIRTLTVKTLRFLDINDALIKAYKQTLLTQDAKIKELEKVISNIEK